MEINKALAAAGFSALVCAGSIFSVTPQSAEAAASRPDVVVILTDDVKSQTPYLWNNRSRTPNLAAMSSHAVKFTQSVVTTPLCGPSRESLCTGRYSHDHGVLGNTRRGAEDSVCDLATRLQGSGYYTIHVGKGPNGIGDVARTASQVSTFASGWNQYDVILRFPEGEGQFYDLKWWSRRSGFFHTGSKPRDHSTNVIARRFARYIRNAPAEKPLYAIASLNSGHYPNVPFAWDDGSAKCSRMVYRRSSVGEKNVSDKPKYIRRLSRLGNRTVSLRNHCEEFLGVDDALGKIRRALRARGTLNNTVFIFTSDNGYLLRNEHRMPNHGWKMWPHATSVPLFVSWPAGFGANGRRVAEPVSNVDIPVTICAIAGCDLPRAVGKSLLPLLRGNESKLSRNFVYLEMLRSEPRSGMPRWCGLKTTRSYSTKATWLFARYENGERELYNLTTDPNMLESLDAKASQQNRIRNFTRMLRASGCPIV